MLVIRMRQQGALKNRQFRIVVVDQRARRDGAYIENLGWFNPQAKGEIKCKIEIERIAHWNLLGARISDRVQHIIDAQAMAPEKVAVLADKRKARKKAMKIKKAAEKK